MIAATASRTVRVQRMRLGAPDLSGRRSPEPVDGDVFDLDADLVIAALGFEAEDLPKAFATADLARDRWGNVAADHDTRMTSLEGVFVAGDIYRGASLVVWGDQGRARRGPVHPDLSRQPPGRIGSCRMTRSVQDQLQQLQDAGLHHPEHEKDACGVGLIADVNGKPRREIVELGIAALKAVWHRGAVDADGLTGDGAGLRVGVPQDFFKNEVARTGHEPEAGDVIVGMVFLPRTDFAARERARAIIEAEILREGLAFYGWRQPPIDTSVLGEKSPCDPAGDRAGPVS